MRSQGHPDPESLPLGRLMDETSIAVERINNSHATTATLLHMAVSGIVNTEANRDFKRVLDRLTGDEQ